MNQAQEQRTTSIADSFLAELVQELDHQDIVGITLGGSYARGEATPYSDIDLACFWQEGVRRPPKRFLYRGGKLVSVKMTAASEMRGMLARPQAAILFASGQHRILLDKDGSVARLLRDIAEFNWETLQAATNESISIWMMLKAEDVHKILGEFWRGNEPGMAYATFKLVGELTLLAAMRYKLLITSDSTYYNQVEAAAGNASAWTRYHRLTLGLEPTPDGIAPVRARGIAALRFYDETLALLRPVMDDERQAIAEQTVEIVRAAVEALPLTDEEREWFKS